jgi:hypothetical protein
MKQNKCLEKIGTFNAIEVVKSYEIDNFGETYTDLSDPERVANMYAYIVGEDVLSTSDTLTKDAWDSPIEEYINAIIAEIERFGYMSRTHSTNSKIKK